MGFVDCGQRRLSYNDVMRVAHLETGMHLYGGAQQVLYLIAGLKAQGVDNVLVCAEGSEIATEADTGAAKLLAVPMSGDADVGFVWRLRRLLEREQVDLLHVHSRRGADLYGGWAAKLVGIPAVVSRRVDNPESRILALSKYGRYQAVIAISTAIMDMLAGLGVPADRLHCVPSAVDARRYRPGDREVLADALCLGQKRPLLGVVSQLIERKGHRYLINALVPLVADYPDLQLVCFGRGPLKEPLEDQVRSLGLKGRVHFVGFRTDLPALLPGLDLLVHPALREGMGVALLEAQAAGIPVVASAVGGIPEAVADQETGLLGPPGDSSWLAQAIDELLRDQPRRAGMGAAAKRRMVEVFSIDAMVAGNLAVYQRVLGK